MPIVDIEIVCAPSEEPRACSVPGLAAALGSVFRSPPGRTWVRVHVLPSWAYAENERTLDPEQLPIFVTVLLAHWPAAQAMSEQVTHVTQAVATSLAVPPDRVHVQYAPEAAGRQAFGGRLID